MAFEFCWNGKARWAFSFDECCVKTLECSIQHEGLEGQCCTDLEAVTTAGRVGYVDADGITIWIHWGKTPPDDSGFYVVVVDLKEITLAHLRCLWIAGVISGDYPEAA